MVALDGENSSILTVESHNACLVFFGWLTAGGLDCLTADYWTKVQYTASVIFDRDDSRLKPETRNVVDPDRTLTMWVRGQSLLDRIRLWFGMMVSALDQPKPPMDVSTRFAYARTFLAHERTLMAWVRNGVVLDHFWLLDLQIFRYGTGYGKGFASVQVIGPRQFSLILIIIGVVALVMDGSAPASDADTQTGIPTNSDIHGGDRRRISLNHGALGSSDEGRVSRGRMSQSGLESFGAYQKARQLFDLVVTDMEALKTNPLCYRLVSQQIGSADSICANIEEGYGRVSRAEYVRFLDFARGSARETRGRYERFGHWLASEIVRQRVELVDEIIGILTSSIGTMRRK